MAWGLGSLGFFGGTVRDDWGPMGAGEGEEWGETVGWVLNRGWGWGLGWGWVWDDS